MRLPRLTVVVKYDHTTSFSLYLMFCLSIASAILLDCFFIEKEENKQEREGRKDEGQKEQDSRYIKNFSQTRKFRTKEIGGDNLLAYSCVPNNMQMQQRQ